LRYYDTSVILSLYLPQAVTAKAILEVEKDKPILIISDWTVVEIKSALSKELRMKQLSKLQTELIWQRFYQDVSDNRYTLLRLSEKVMTKAHELIELGSGLRSGDALHLAVAWQHGRLGMVTGDKEQAKVAKSHRLKVTLLEP
jgi:uncharacterized protein